MRCLFQPKGKNGFISVQLLLAAVFIGIIGIGLGIYISSPRFEGVNNSLHQAGAVISKTFGDIFRQGDNRKLAAEIDISANSQEPTQAGDSGTNQNFLQKENYQTSTLKSAQPHVIKENTQQESSTQEISRTEENTNVILESGETPEAPSVCIFSNSASPTHQIIFNEIAWMGSPQRSGETATAAANNEWIEFKNSSDKTVDLSGWKILDESEKLEIIFGESDKIEARKFFLLERADDDSVIGIKADKIYSGALSNSGEWLRLFNRQCELIDEIDAHGGWPAGDNATKQTLERNAGDFGWHTSASPGGTPKAENSKSQAAQTISSTPAAAAAANFIVGVSMQGTGSGIVTSTPAGINCGFDCLEEYPAGTTVVLGATPSTNSTFDGWSGACKGKELCAIVATGTISVSALFTSLLPPQETAAPPPQPPENTASHVLISEIMAGIDGNANYEFIELYNPGASSIDLTGWTVKKRTSTGSESTLIVASRFDGKSIPAGRYFLLARDGGYSGAVVPDVLWPTSNSYALAYTNNAVMLYDASGNKVDEVSWTEIPQGKSFTRESWSSNNFIIQGNPTPQNSGS